MGQKMIVVALCDDSVEKGLREKSLSAGADTVLPEDFTPYSLVELISEKLGIDKVVIAKDEFDKRRDVVDQLAESYRERKKSAKEPPPKVQVMLPDGRDLGLLLLTDDAGKGR
ncbi:MAG: hypothetical protein D6806_13995 [Deltaproteobacteria bacterium]|nr:MAG: hypothetical protein D6806_13995 [Deltaproteobacteria bacterium]